MSFHSREKYPEYNTPQIRAELALHNMATDKPSQMSDVFRSGWLAARRDKSIDVLIEELKEVIECDFSTVEDAKKSLKELMIRSEP